MRYVVSEWFTSDMSDSQACNQCLCRCMGLIPARGTRYVAPYKRDFWRGSCTGGFLRALLFPPPSKGSYSPNHLGRRNTVAAVLSPRRVAWILQGNLWQKCYKIQNHFPISGLSGENSGLLFSISPHVPAQQADVSGIRLSSCAKNSWQSFSQWCLFEAL
jgi:hypothetical protein